MLELANYTTSPHKRMIFGLLCDATVENIKTVLEIGPLIRQIFWSWFNKRIQVAVVNKYGTTWLPYVIIWKHWHCLLIAWLQSPVFIWHIQVHDRGTAVPIESRAKQSLCEINYTYLPLIKFLENFTTYVIMVCKDSKLQLDWCTRQGF